MERDQTAPLLFTAWLRAFNRVVLADKLGDAFDDYWDMHPDVIRLILTEHPEWCEEPAEGAASCAPLLATALEQALAELRKRYGDDMNGWQWGHAHEAQFANQLWAKIPVIGGFIALAIPADGGYDTINRGATPVANADDPYADTHGSTLRMIVDLSDIAASRFMIAPGQSGNPLSPHYSDLMTSWRDFAYLTFGKSAAAYARAGAAMTAPAPPAAHSPISAPPPTPSPAPCCARPPSPRRRCPSSPAPRSCSSSRRCIRPARSRSAARSPSC